MSKLPAVLVVEDDLSTLHLLVAVVNHLGLQARPAGDGRVALLMIAEALPEVMLLDLIMPEVDGFEVLRQTKQRWPALLKKTIVITAAAIRNVNEFPDLGLVRSFLSKPLDIDQLGNTILGCAGRPPKKIGRDGAYETPPGP